MEDLASTLSGLDDKRLTAPFKHLQRAVAALEAGEDVDLDELGTLELALRMAARDAGDLETELLDYCDAVSGLLAREDFRIVRTTEGRCNQCLEPVDAEVRRYEDRITLHKECKTCGPTIQLMSKDPSYWADLDKYYFRVNGENYPQRDYIVRMTETCNLQCPICLAKANTEDTPDLDLSGLEKLLSERRGIKIDLMAAEPTIRKDLPEWIRKVKASGNIAALHTNGIRLAKYEYAKELHEAGVDEVFLQFDGFDDDANEVLRGRKLLDTRMKALENLRKLGIATSLIVVIARGLNEEQISKTFHFATQPENSFIKEVFFMGLRMLGSAKDAGLGDQTLMPDELLTHLTEQEPRIRRSDIKAFNKLYFAMLSALRVKKCLYVQHYLVFRDGDGGWEPVSNVLDLRAGENAADSYADRLERRGRILATAGLAGSLAAQGLKPTTWGHLRDLHQLERLTSHGMNLREVPKSALLLGFITACDPENFDAQVAINCGKGELSVDGGFIESGAVANVNREARFAESGKVAPTRRTKK
ncbi:MAG: radical SAM protein [Proteobacteria bacterium]|nr:radical SAM protein [Pseudomonadota bacterium]MCP4916568.1 radical SAM protein [Pseudomonadota bacterium]